MPENSPTKAPTIDSKGARNKTTAWLEFIDLLSSWLWQDNTEGAARWTLVLDDAERHGSTTHPPRTASGLKAQVPPSIFSPAAAVN